MKRLRSVTSGLRRSFRIVLKGTLGTYVPDYVDELVGDMGLQTCRKDNVREKYFEPFTADRYEGLGEERRRARNEQGDSTAARRPHT